ncbi:MAG TPA: hypothetical protein VEY89_12355, partial [Candidatus Dormibacteraeota bacterium]|nr:hypothetical protein [Candidatus Dormibacteraeota bacterium]
MRVSVNAPRSELGAIVSERSADLVSQGGHERVVINVALQAPNSLLHDGQAWKRYPPQRLLEDTRAALRSSRRASFLVHASYLFAGANDAALEPGAALRPLIDAAL